MAFGSPEPRIRPSLAAARCAKRALRRRQKAPPEARAGGAEVLDLANHIASREPVSAPQVLGLIDRHFTDRAAARESGDPAAKALELYALLGGAAMHRQVYAVVERILR